VDRAARYVRQILLPQIGEVGQRRIEASRVRIGGDSLAHEVAALYARGAGFSDIEPGPIDEDALAPRGIARGAEARAVLAGSRAALAEIRRAIGLSNIKESS